MSTITTLANLEALYGTPGEASLAKEVDRIVPAYKTLIDTSPFVTLATSGPDRLDCSPRGDAGSVLHVTDKKTVMVPDRRWNNRVDPLRNIIHDPHVALLFLIPDSGNTMPIQGRAKISVKPELLAAYAVENKEPRRVVVVAVDAIYFQCARAVLRADLWNRGEHVNLRLLPSAGTMLAQTSDGRVGGADYDKT
jgi:PPOX class probable FMN-dependent enzyme